MNIRVALDENIQLAKLVIMCRDPAFSCPEF